MTGTGPLCRTDGNEGSVGMAGFPVIAVLTGREGAFLVSWAGYGNVVASGGCLPGPADRPRWDGPFAGLSFFM